MNKNYKNQAGSGFQVGKKISNRRKEMGFSQGKLSELLEKRGVDISQKMISHYENDDIKAPDVNTVIAMGEVLGIDDLVALYFPQLYVGDTQENISMPKEEGNIVSETTATYKNKEEPLIENKYNTQGDKFKVKSAESDNTSLTSVELNHSEMIHRILGIMEEQNANMRLIALVAKDATAATLNTTATNRSLAVIIERYLGGDLEGRPETSHTHVKQTGD